MSIIAANTQWIMLIGGLMTLTLLQGVFAPRAMMRNLFGEDVTGPAATLVVRSWSALVAGGGVMLVYAAFFAEWRPLLLIYVILGKLMFVALVLSHGRLFLRRQAGLAVVIDTVLVVLFALCLIGRGFNSI